MSEKYQIRDNAYNRALVHTLTHICNILHDAGYSEHETFIAGLIESIEDEENLREKLNGVELWGGAGAVWEIELENPSLQKALRVALVQLLKEMKEEKLLDKRAASVYRLIS